MRLKFALVSAAALSFAGAAFADAPQMTSISFSPEFQTSLDEEYGAREGEYLRSTVEHAVARALARRGATPGLTIDVSIIDADPNRPTFEQMGATPGLDGFRSISIGGAELHAVLRDANGVVVSEVSHQRYNHSLADLTGAETTWSEANSAIRQFANKVADAYVANAR